MFILKCDNFSQLTLRPKRESSENHSSMNSSDTDRNNLIDEERKSD
jgi:hypothetical protein